MEKSQLMYLLQSNHVELKSAAGLYGVIIERQTLSSSVQRIEDMRKHQGDLQAQADHQKFKMSEEKCLSCPNVLSCTRKC